MLLSKPCVIVRASDPDQHLIRILAKNSINAHPSHSVWKSPKMSHFLLRILALTPAAFGGWCEACDAKLASLAMLRMRLLLHFETLWARILLDLSSISHKWISDAWASPLYRQGPFEQVARGGREVTKLDDTRRWHMTLQSNTKVYSRVTWIV